MKKFDKFVYGFVYTCVIIAVTIILFSAVMSAKYSTYSRCMTVTNLNYEKDLVTCTDSVGYVWQFFGCEDFEINDIVCAEMDTNGTESSILDDSIVSAVFSGYRAE